MFNIPIRKERGMIAGDFVVPKQLPFKSAHREINMLYVISEDAMRNDEYFTAIPVMYKHPHCENVHDDFKAKKTLTFRKEDFKVKRDYVKFFYESLDEDDRNRYYKGFPNLMQWVNDYKDPLKQRGLILNHQYYREEWIDIKSKDSDNE